MTAHGFDRLHESVQYHVVNSLGWPGLRPLQNESVAPIHEGRDCVLLAPTARGELVGSFGALPLSATGARKQPGTTTFALRRICRPKGRGLAWRHLAGRPEAHSQGSTRHPDHDSRVCRGAACFRVHQRGAVLRRRAVGSGPSISFVSSYPNALDKSVSVISGSTDSP